MADMRVIVSADSSLRAAIPGLGRSATEARPWEPTAVVVATEIAERSRAAPAELAGKNPPGVLAGQAILSCSSPKSAMSLRVPPRAAT